MSCAVVLFEAAYAVTVVCVQICACDEILAGMEGLLGRFQGDLGNISGEIR